MNLKKEYRNKLRVRKEIVEKHLSNWNVQLDPRIAETVVMLLCHQFSVRIHGAIHRKKLLFPRIEIRLIHSIKFHRNPDDLRMETVLSNATYNRFRLEKILERARAKPYGIGILNCSFRRSNESQSIILCDEHLIELGMDLRNSQQFHQAIIVRSAQHMKTLAQILRRWPIYE